MKSNFLSQKAMYIVSAILLAVGFLVFDSFRRATTDLKKNQGMLLTFRSLQQVNQNLNENVLRSRSFMLKNYDPLVAGIQQAENLCLKIQSQESAFMNSKDAALVDSANTYCKMLHKKIALIEKFKSKNSILRNSLEYLPTLVLQLHGSSYEFKAENLLNEVLRYAGSQNEELKESIQKKVFQMKTLARKDEGLKNLVLHTQIILEASKDRAQEEGEILSSEVDVQLSQFEKKYHVWHESKETRLNYYYMFLLAMCAAFGFVIDYTVRKLQKMFLKIQNLNETLESKVELRTKELSKALSELEQNQQMLLQSTKMSALGEMAGGIAHEINTPLGAILLNTEMVYGMAQDIEQTDMYPPLEAISKTVERISKIITGLRRFSRNSALDNKQTTAISHIIDDTLTLCSEKFKANSVDLQVKVPDAPVTIQCIPEQISQVLLNLLSNSVDAISIFPKDQRWLKLEVQEHSEIVEISVTDCGPGIPESVQQKLMQPFFTTKEVGKGTGLGLSISKGIIEAHDGRFFYDKNSKNTRFVIQLPQSLKVQAAA